MNRFKLSLSIYIISTLVALTTALLGAFAYYDYRSSRTELMRGLAAKASLRADELSASLVLPMWNFDREQALKIAENAMRDPELAGLVLQWKDVKSTVNQLGKLPGKSALELPVEEREIRGRDQALGHLVLYSDDRLVHSELSRSLVRKLSAILALDLALVLGLGLILWSSVLGPLKKIENYAAALSGGEGEAPDLEPQPVAELDSLGRSIEKMVSLLKKRHADLERYQQSLSRAQKLESVWRLAGGLAHDFNNVLAAIGLCAGLAKQGLPPEHEALEEILLIQEAVKKSSAITGQLLAFAQRQMIEMKVLDLASVVEDLSQLLRRTLGEDIALATRSTAEPARVMGNRGQLEQVIVNLAVNARDAMPQGGRLDIDTRLDSLGSARVVAHPGAAPGDYVVVRVQDKGLGMPPEVRERLFEPFFTTKQPGKGTGLGLATCFGIVSQHGGFIQVESEVGQGSAFEVWLPRTQKEEVAFSPSAPATSRPRGSESVLLVEDEETVGRVLVRALSQEGYAARWSRNPVEALEILRSQPPKLLVTDVVMPGMDGVELSRRAKEIHPPLRVLFISGHARSATAELFKLGPEEAFLPKPFTVEELSAKLAQLLE